MRDDFAAFILTHGRPEQVGTTIRAMLRAGYTGDWFLLLDTDDDTAGEYAERWGEEHILTFDKDEVAQTFDLADNGGSRGVIVYARNAVDPIAERLGYRYLIQLDDDYTTFGHRLDRNGTLAQVNTHRLDDVLEAYIEFLDVTGALTVAFAQGGDFAGGTSGVFWRDRLKRKAMNTFICKVGRPVNFVGRINEDVNTYVWRGSQGDLLMTLTDFGIQQKRTQSQDGGMTGAYVNFGTYVKSFYTVMYAPSCTKIATIGETDMRIHHHIQWNLAVPKIISPEHRKTV